MGAKHILIVDDIVENIEMLCELFSNTSYQISSATSGSEALNLCRDKKFDILLIDFRMPEMNGLETLQNIRIKTINLMTPTIFMLAKTDSENIGPAYSVGAVDIITKPFHVEELLARVKTHLLLQEQNNNLKALNATKDRLFSIIGHDLRGPVSGIKAVIELLLTNFDLKNTDLLLKFLNELHKSSSATYELLENLLAWSRCQQNEIDFRPQKVSLKAEIDCIIELLSELTRRKGISIYPIMASEITVMADVNMITTVIRNLLSNAIKFSKHDSLILLQVVEQDAEVLISVKDEGVGISDEDIEKLFNHNEHHTTYGTDAEKGCGLGLLLCKEFVDRHHGRIWVESTLGQGSEFKFTIPLELAC